MKQTSSSFAVGLNSDAATPLWYTHDKLTTSTPSDNYHLYVFCMRRRQNITEPGLTKQQMQLELMGGPSLSERAETILDE